MGVRNTVSIRPWVIVASLAAAAPGATAQDVGTRWGCHLAEQQLVCLVEQAATAPAATMPADLRLPPIVHALRQRPAGWRGRQVRIPLFNQPFDDSPLQPLAQAVLCGGVHDCRAEIRRDRDLSLLAVLDFADANDPLLQAGD